MSKINIEGTLGSDPELRFSGAGTAFANFSVAVNYKKNDEKLTSWFRCVAFGELAETIAESLHKGQRIMVSGRMTEEEYTDKEGEQRRSWSLMVDDAGASLRWQTCTVTKTERSS